MARFACAGALVAALACSGCNAPAATLEPETLATRYQANVLEQVAEAWTERDFDRMEQLLAQNRSGATSAQGQQFATFEQLLRAGQLQRDGVGRRGFTWDATADGGRTPPDLEMDEKVAMKVAIEAKGGFSFDVLANRDGGRSMLLVSMNVEDWLVDGSRMTNAIPFRYELPSDLHVSGTQPFSLAVPEIDPPPAAIQIRRVSFSGVFMMAGVRREGVLLPLTRLELEPAEVVYFPKGFRKVRAKAAKVLEIALGAPATHLGHVLVASWFVARDGSPADRQAAIGRLIELLRSGPGSCEKTARSCLLRLAGSEAPPQRDREGWLRWFALREKKR